MNSTQTRGTIALTLSLLTLAACGGGGGGTGSSGSSATPPTSGSYSWALKAQGPTDALKYGLSLIHPSQPANEFLIEFGSSVLTDAKVVSSGIVDVGGRQANALQPYALVYIVGGDVRRLPLQADGTAPSTRVQRAQSTTACQFLADANGKFIGEANDYGAPENSRFVVTTAGSDGQCNTADDGAAEITLGGSTGLTFTSLSAGAPLGMFRSATTLAPIGWIFPKSVFFWGPSPVSSVVMRGDAEAAFTSAVVSTAEAALVDDGTQLSVLDFAISGAPTELKLSSSTTGGGGWIGIGFDANNYYAYRNGGTSTSSTWTMLKVTRASPSASVLASGTGQLTVASMGSTLLYATVVGSSGNSLLQISKTSGVPVQVLESTASTTLTTVQTSANGVHELWRIVNVGTTAVNYAIEMIDEAGTKLYTTSAGGFPMTVPDADTANFNASESRTRFVFANGYGSRAFGDASLVGYDTATKTATSLGNLPGSADFGADIVFANAIGGSSGFMTGFAAPSVNGAIQTTGAKVFSFDFAAAGSLAYTSTTQ